MSSMNHVARQLEEMGLTVAVEGGFILAEDPDLDFERSHDGVRGVSRWFAETKEEYNMTIADLLNESKDEEQAIEFTETQAVIEEEMATWTKDEQKFQANLELAEVAREEERLANEQDGAEKFGPALPEKGHVISSAQLALAKELNKQQGLMSPKEIWQATQGNNQDRGGVPNPAGYIKDMKQDLPAVIVLMKGQRFMAPEGWMIQERRQPTPAFPNGRVLCYGSIYQARKASSQATGSRFSLVRR